MQAHRYAVERWEAEGGALKVEPPLALPLFSGRQPSTATRRRVLGQLVARKRARGIAWLVGLSLLVLVLLNISGLLGVSH